MYKILNYSTFTSIIAASMQICNAVNPWYQYTSASHISKDFEQLAVEKKIWKKILTYFNCLNMLKLGCFYSISSNPNNLWTHCISLVLYHDVMDKWPNGSMVANNNSNLQKYKSMYLMILLYLLLWYVIPFTKLHNLHDLK